MTYAEKELEPLGFRLVEKQGEERVVLSFGDFELRFNCVCPAYPTIKALGCPMHHSGPGGSSLVETAKKICKVIA